MTNDDNGAVQPYPDLGDYALISGAGAAALISKDGSIDWCCLPRYDSGSCFGRLLDWNNGGHCSIHPAATEYESARRYLEGALVLETSFRLHGGEAKVTDCFTIDAGDGSRRQLLRIIEGMRGQMDLELEIQPRFDYGEMKPWLRHEGARGYSAIGGNDGLFFHGNVELEVDGRHDIKASITVRANERLLLAISFVQPESIEAYRPGDAKELDEAYQRTLQWWRDWSCRGVLRGPYGPGALRSALILKGLGDNATGAIAAAPTTSLPESPGGSRNWDYRYSWIRDSTFAVGALSELGYAEDANRFRKFIERSAAGSINGLQIMYGVGGERRLLEFELDHLNGYRGARPVRAGNAASEQLQLDAYGELLDLAWRWHKRGESPDDDYWRFIVDVVNAAVDRWQQPDSGMWEMRGKPRHFVQSKAACWAAIDKGIRLAEECVRKAPEKEWRKARGEIRDYLEHEGYDEKRGVFVQAVGSKAMDAALLLLPMLGFIDYDDPRMVRTTDAIMDELSEDGLLLRYRANDNLPGKEGVFIACSFWLAECLVGQGRITEAREVFERAMSTCSDLGLFSEEYDPKQNMMLGNYPLGLTHLSHIRAAVALANAEKTS